MKSKLEITIIPTDEGWEIKEEWEIKKLQK